ncbi:coiled-coil-helix-coiled-coil-helix domain containing 3a isoform X1 [Anoplopoma fimbria]|uniref:coiled-coil-helix-coiled-coil-helix domain containing 3a isoform X1 n=1 Tax=Anoplopoma fimbria TaxID=229290 RepID=UPI0023EC46FF|nr:coiled-coil-helix-coiled-coil-helix domain containing 3a isoform X1 [Anoplopoma fimbria]
MGANSSTRRVSFESDENENITVVKGIRLSENVINRMREAEAPPKPRHASTPPPSMAPSLAPSPLLRPVPPLFDPITSLPPPPPLVAPPAPPPPPPARSATETVAAPPPPPPPQPPTEQVAAPTITDMVLPSSSPAAAASAVAAPAFEPVAAPPPAAPAAVEPVILPTSVPPAAPIAPPILAPAVVEEIAPLAPPPLAIEPSPLPINQSVASSPPVIEPIAPKHVIAPSSVAEPKPAPLPVKMEPIIAPPPPPPESEPLPSPPVLEPVAILRPSGDTLSLQPAQPFAAPPLSEYTAPCEPVAPPPQPLVDPVFLAPAPEPVVVPESVSVPPPPPPPPPAAVVDEEALRKKISDELYKSLEQDRAKAEQELQAWVEAEKARAAAQAQDDAQSQVQDEVSRILSVERAGAKESIQQAVLRERIATEDEKLRAHLYAKQLGAREADLNKQDAFYREQVARLEERSAQFYKVTTENYHKAADQVNAKFKRYEAYPVCADLQGQILACYKENVGKTLNCSNIAARYLQCVNNSKQNKLRTGG